MTKYFNCLTTIVELNTSPESLKIKKDEGLDAWIMYTICLAYIRKYKGLLKNTTEYFHFKSDVKRSTQMKDDRMTDLEKYFLDQEIFFLDAYGKIQHSELFDFLDNLGEVRRKAIANRWNKAEAMEPKEQGKSDEAPVNSSLYKRLNKIAIDGSHKINERNLLAISRAFPEDVLNYFIENLPAFKKAMVNVKANFPFCLGEWKLIDHLSKHWENKLELKKELPAWVNAPVIANNPTPAGNYKQPQAITNDPNLPDFSGKYRKIFTKKSPAAYSWAEFVSVLIEVMDRPILKPTVESRWFMSLHSPEEWMILFDKWFLVDNIANIVESKQRRLKELISVDKLRMVESENAIADRKANEVVSNG